MGGFLTACVDSSEVIIPLLDTIIQCKIREEESSYISTVVGLYQLQLFTDINHLFCNNILHVVDSDSILSCEVFHKAKNTAVSLQSIQTPKSDHLLENLEADEFGNVSASFDLKGESHRIA